jgi:type I restriction enzyme M protein
MTTPEAIPLSSPTDAIGDLVGRLWSLCHLMRDDGIAYHQYVTELSYLLFLKMAKELRLEASLPKGCRWSAVVSAPPHEQLAVYRRILHDVANSGRSHVKAIFTSATTMVRNPSVFAKLIAELDAIDWYEAKREGLGELYEGLLARNVAEKKSGAGQYFTPRPLIEAIVNVTQPRINEVIQDPAAGTGGFLIVADQYRKRAKVSKQMAPMRAMELVPETHRLLLMNAVLHGIQGDFMLGDALSQDGARLGQADVVLTNPPFGTKRGGALTQRSEFAYPTSNKQLAFLQHVYGALKPPGFGRASRAAVVVPDNVLFEDGAAASLRRNLFEAFHVHTILRLPTGIFYAHGVKTNVIFFSKVRQSSPGQSSGVWIYDLRSGVPPFRKSNPLTISHFDEFVQVYGDDPVIPRRSTSLANGRFRHFSQQFVRDRNYNLDITWSHTEEGERQDSQDAREIAELIGQILLGALEDIAQIQAALKDPC